MPVLYIDGRCYAHTENLDEFFKRITFQNAQALPEDLIMANDPPIPQVEGNIQKKP
jgi:hypothetical protein